MSGHSSRRRTLVTRDGHIESLLLLSLESLLLLSLALMLAAGDEESAHGRPTAVCERMTPGSVSLHKPLVAALRYVTASRLSAVSDGRCCPSHWQRCASADVHATLGMPFQRAESHCAAKIMPPPDVLEPPLKKRALSWEVT